MTLRQISKLLPDQPKVKMLMEKYRSLFDQSYHTFQGAITTPFVRYLPNSRTGLPVLHSVTIPNTFETKKKGKRLQFITLGCSNMDDAGFCQGHFMTKKQFIKEFCGGVQPAELEKVEV